MTRLSEPVAVFGGSFDPVHRGHIEIARRVIEEGLYRSLLWVPAARNPLKASGPIAPDSDRLAMLRLATADFSWSDVSDIDIRRGGASYTIDTLHALRQEYRLETRPGFILGEDTLLTLPQWHRSADLVRACCFTVFPRQAADSEIKELETWLLQAGGCLQRIQMESIPISSTTIRDRIRAGHACSHLVPAPVAGYIASRGLYVSADS